METDVFISYTRPDSSKAFLIHDILQSNQLRSWMAASGSNGVRAGKFFKGEIVRAITSSKVFVLVYSDHCNRSEEILKEVQHRPKGQPTIVVRLDKSPYNDGLSNHLRGIRHIDVLGDDPRDAFNRLLLDVRRCIHGPAQTESTDQSLLSAGLSLLQQRKYDEAADALEQYVHIDADNNQARFYLALALIGGKKTRKLDGLLVKKMEDFLHPALGSPDDGFINVLLALIKHGHYTQNGFRVPAPTVVELMKEVYMDNENAALVLAHLDEPDNMVWQVVSQTFK